MFVLFALMVTTTCCIAAGRLRRRDNGLAIVRSILAGIVVMPLSSAMATLVGLPLGIGAHGRTSGSYSVGDFASQLGFHLRNGMAPNREIGRFVCALPNGLKDLVEA